MSWSNEDWGSPRTRSRKRRVLIAVLATTSILGFSAGFAHAGKHLCRHRSERWQRLEARVAKVCVEAALNHKAPPTDGSRSLRGSERQPKVE